jgi:signal transduction histidine kinase
MVLRGVKKSWITQGIWLRVLLVIPFLLQISFAVGMTGYFSLTHGEKAVNDLADRLMTQTTRLVHLHLDSYLAIPPQINQLNLNAINRGQIKLQDLETAGQLFWKQSQVFPHFSSIGYALTNGNYIGSLKLPGTKEILISEVSSATNWKGYDFNVNEKGDRLKVAHKSTYDPRSESWYTEPIKAKRELWTSIYTSSGEGYEEYIAASFNAPMYDKTGKLLGVIGIDLLLTEISNFLQTLDFSPSGKVFIIEHDGMLIAHSAKEKPFHIVNGAPKRFDVLNDPNTAIQSIARELKRDLQGFDRIQTPQKLHTKIQGEGYFIRVLPWRDNLGLDWLVVVAVPESDFMAQIHINTRNTILLCLLVLGCSTLGGIYTSEWISRPIFRLTRKAVAIASGKLSQTANTSKIREISILTSAFNQMVQQLQASFAALEQANEELENRVIQRTQELSQAFTNLQKTQAQLIQNEKMSSLGRMVAGIAHEVNNPISFISGNLQYVDEYVGELLLLVQLYQEHIPNPPKIVQTHIDKIDVEFLQDDLNKIMQSMQTGSDRIRDIVLSLRNFSRLDEAEFKQVNLHEGIDSTLLLLQHRLNLESGQTQIQVIKNYGELPQIWCYPGQINQTVMNILINAIDVLHSSNENPTPTITIRTDTIENDWVRIAIADNGVGIPIDIQPKIFDPFFTTKTVGKGIGLGLSVSYQIITEQHGGKLYCNSNLEKSAELIIEIPVKSFHL